MATETPQVRRGPAEPGQLPAGSATQLNQQAVDARALYEQNQGLINELKEKLAAGEITQDQYFQGVGVAFDAQLANLQGDLEEQGRPEAAAAVPVGAGQTDQPVDGSAADPFAAPMGVDLTGAATAARMPALNEDEALLYGPTARPDEHISAGANRATGKIPVPPDVYRYLPALAEAAQDPDAPAQLHQLLAILNYHLST